MDNDLQARVRATLEGRKYNNDLQGRVRATLEGRKYNTRGAFNAPVTKNIVESVPEIPGAVAGAFQDFTKKSREQKEALPDYLKRFAPFIRGLDVVKTLGQETLAGGLSLVKSATDNIPKGPRTYTTKEGQEITVGRSDEEQKALEENFFGREVKSIQEGYVEPTKEATEKAGSGVVERTALPIVAGTAGLFFESPFGRLVPKESRGVIMNLLKEDLGDISKTTDRAAIQDILNRKGAGQVSVDNDAVDALVRSTTPKQAARALDKAEARFVDNAKKSEQIKESIELNQQRQTPTPTTRPRAEAPATPTQPDTARPTVDINPAATRQNIRQQTLDQADEARFVREEVLPGAPVGRVPAEQQISQLNKLSNLGKQTLGYTIDTVRVGDGVVPKRVENNFRTIAGNIGLNTDKSIKSLVEDMVRVLDRDTNLSKTIRPDDDFYWKQTTTPSYLRKNRQAGFAGVPDGFRKRKQTPAAREVINETNRSSSIDNLVIGPDATRPAGQPDAAQAPSAKTGKAQSTQPVSTPPKSPENSPILSSLEQSNPKQAEIASKEYTDYKKAVDKILNPSRGSWASIREGGQDAFIRMRKLQEAVAKGEPIPDNINVDQAETLFHGRVHSQLETLGDEIRDIDRSMVRAAKDTNVDAAEFRSDVDSYLHALHAPERNAKLGDGAAGITDADATKTIQALQDTGRFTQIKEQADRLLELNRRTLDVLLEGQLIDKKTYNLLKETYQNHVPLMRVMDEGEDLVSAMTGKGFDVKSSGLKKAKGSDRDVADITNNIVQVVQQAIIRSEKNLVNLTTARWARENPELGLINEVKPKAIGKTFDEQGAVLEDLSKNPNILTFFEDGKKKYLKIEDETLAKALKGVNVESVPTIFRGVAFLTRLYGQLHTRFNYEFAFSNVIRDAQEMAVDMSSRSGMGFGGAGNALRKIPANQKAVTDFIFGRDTEGARLYKQMRDDGGTTGGLGLSSRQEIDMEIQKIQKMHQSSPRRAAEATLRAVDKWNMVFEDATRLSVYRAALERGNTRKQAAVLAKESTINFNKKGTHGPTINGLWMFSNASIQGTTKVLRAMKNPKVAAATAATIAASVESANTWNDSIDPEWRDKVTKWDRSANLVIMLPSDDGSAKYITMPVSWGLKPMKMMYEYTSDLARGEIDPIDGLQGVITSVLQAYNPLAGDESLLRTLTPTVAKTPIEISSNRGWHGNQIKPSYDIDAPASSQYFSSLGNSSSGRFFIGATEELSNRGIIELNPADVDYAFNQYIGGVGRSVNKMISAIDSIGDDEPLPANQRPVLSRFFKTRTQEQVYNDLFYTRREQADKDKARERVLDKRRVQPIYEEIQVLRESGSVAEARQLLESLSDEDYEVYKKLSASDARRNNVGDQIQQYSTVREIEQLLENGNETEARNVLESLTDEEYKAYKKAKEAMGVEF